jgi:hypothetical protein
VPRIDLTDAELAAVTAAVRGVIEGDRFPHAPRLVSLHTALAKFADAAAQELAVLASPSRRAGRISARSVSKRPGSTGVGRASLRRLQALGGRAASAIRAYAIVAPTGRQPVGA